MIKRMFAALCCIIALPTFAQETITKESKKMEWFDDAKLGIFIHWGIYAVNGLSESWSFFNNYTSHDNYLQQLNGFTGKNYNPQDWVNLIEESGAKYTVITTKHHDGIALWDTKGDKGLSTAKDAVARKDVLTPFIQAVKKSKLKTGLYFSLPDWSHPYYDIKTRTQKRYELKDDPTRWNNFVSFYQKQLTELSQQFKPDLLWFDGDWEHSSAEWKAEESLALLRKYNPNIIINSRLNHHGDYETPEQGIPVVRPQGRYWELCYTMNDSWGFQHFDQNYKTPNMIVRTLVDCISMGGNLLLDIGPKEDGTIPEEQVAILKELRRWTKKHAEAVYGTRAGIGFDYVREKNAFSKDGKTLYVYLDALKKSLLLYNLEKKPLQIRLVGSQENVDYKYHEYSLDISLEKNSFDPVCTVVAIDFEDKPAFDAVTVGMIPSVYGGLNIESTIKGINYYATNIAHGYNLFKGMLNDDGSILNKNLVFASEDVKTWVKKHAEVLYAAKAGIDANHYTGYSALSPDKQTLYLFVEGKPTGPIALKGIKNAISRVRIVGEGSMIGHKTYNKLYWSDRPGIIYIDIPEDRLDKNMTVIAVLLDRPIELHKEEVKAIENNL
ncbi:alpha-L-fucosidase [Sphingobacterium bovistauri]|uniref:alpha-L-fucosidase n=1 Tax=Sphingobacterium bovistauri TaxID=2781959 RepID=A0ABS7Z6P3_9SPHI|nr:alpha-L-fucosidase [Sphingobacterium bovistauri]MCA5005858.1 alpha-L-fucosidase [Sphingobacterium bovistauri]